MADTLSAGQPIARGLVRESPYESPVASRGGNYLSGGGRSIPQHRQEALSVPLELDLSDAADRKKFCFVVRAECEHLLQGLVVENDVRWHILFNGKRLPAGAQGLPEVAILVRYRL